MAEITTLGPSDVEIDRKHIDAIISVFPSNDPVTCVKDLIKGLYLIHQKQANMDTTDEKIKQCTEENMLTMLQELKTQFQKDQEQADDYDTKFVEKMKYS